MATRLESQRGFFSFDACAPSSTIRPAMPKTSLTKDEVKSMLLLACERIIAAEPQLSEADRNLGDGDHGLGMQRGMTAAKEKLEAGDVESIEKAFASVGMAMMSSMGERAERSLAPSSAMAAKPSLAKKASMPQHSPPSFRLAWMA